MKIYYLILMIVIGNLLVSQAMVNGNTLSLQKGDNFTVRKYSIYPSIYADFVNTVENQTTWNGEPVLNVSTKVVASNGSYYNPYTFYYTPINSFQSIGDNYTFNDSSYIKEINFDSYPNETQYSTGTINVTYEQIYHYYDIWPKNEVTNISVIEKEGKNIYNASYRITADAVVIHDQQIPCWKINETSLGYSSQFIDRSYNNSLYSYYYQMNYFTNRSGLQSYAYNNLTKKATRIYVHFPHPEFFNKLYWVTKDFGIIAKSYQYFDFGINFNSTQLDLYLPFYKTSEVTDIHIASLQTSTTMATTSTKGLDLSLNMWYILIIGVCILKKRKTKYIQR